MMTFKTAWLVGTLIGCTPALASVGTTSAHKFFDMVSEAVQQQKSLDEGDGVKVTFSATHHVLGEVDLVTPHTSGFALIPDKGQTSVVSFEKDGLLLDIEVLRDFQGKTRVVLDGKGSVLNSSCVLESQGECHKALSVYQAREQLLLPKGVSQVRIGDYHLNIHVEGLVAK